MTKYEISAYIDGIKHTEYVFASNYNAALELAFEIFSVDDVYVKEVCAQ